MGSFIYYYFRYTIEGRIFQKNKRVREKKSKTKKLDDIEGVFGALDCNQDWLDLLVSDYSV